MRGESENRTQAATADVCQTAVGRGSKLLFCIDRFDAGRWEIAFDPR